MEKLNRLGEKFTSIKGCTGTIIEYFTCENITVQFEDGSVVKNISYGNIKKGIVKNPMHPSVHGIGYIGIGKYVKTFNNKKTKIGSVWENMIGRSYSGNSSTYTDCLVVKEWHNLQIFGDWYEKNYNPEIMEGWELDKDILINGNKMYSPETCCFVPHEINSVIIKCNTIRGNYPIGVCRVKNKYRAEISKNKTNVFLGLFDTPKEAFQAYKIAKEAYIKELANKYKGQITEQCYQALLDYEVKIND